MISIIVPIFNSEKYLERLFASLSTQTNSDFEVILVDDGSTDSSLMICKEYALRDNRYKIISQNNQGTSIARNNGLKVASGDWITFIDSDDYIEQGYLSIGKDPAIDIYLQNWTIFGGAYARLEHLDKGTYKGENLNKFLARNMHMDVFRMVSCKFYKKSIIDLHNIRFQPQFKVGEDTLFMMEYLKYTKSIQVVDTGNYKYYRPVNWGGKYCIQINDAIDFFNAFISRYKEQPYHCWKILDFMVHWYPNVIEDFNTNKNVWYSVHSVKFAQNKTFFHKGTKNAISLLILRLKILLNA